jgi:hypothetical protein
MHTYSLLTAHADRSTIASADLPLLDAFLEEQKVFQEALREQIAAKQSFTLEQKTPAAVLDHFRLLQATDKLSLLTCVNFSQPAHLLHPLPLRNGGYMEVLVHPAGSRHFRLDPYPLVEDSLNWEFPARHVKGKRSASAAELQVRFHSAPAKILPVTISRK